MLKAPKPRPGLLSKPRRLPRRRKNKKKKSQQRSRRDPGGGSALPEIALTGGIGSGKSTVADGLVRRGAVLIDADRIVRDLQQPGEPVFAAMVERWGSGIVAADGTLDRSAVAAVVFNDAAELDALNAIVHPAVGEAMAEQRAAAARQSPGAVVVLDIPLLVTPDGEIIAERYRGLAGVLVVDAAPEVAVRRLVAQRGLSDDAAWARVSSQADRETRLSAADFVIDNNGGIDELSPQIDAAYRWAASLP
ncbi:MAG: dephospho-CoA kinase [Acidimicrobiaceae bacterium]|nr:dephospho-CoA kinase [Acidimicrobiaceae bacterium]MCY4280772.1 dephospho-CoA kinase [Acidimicrobiaceae bacterium]